METLTRGQVARLAKTGTETIRFYERKGLIEPPPRNSSGYRQYPPDTVRRLIFIKHAKELGFSLKEISELLNLRVARGATCADVKRRAGAKITSVENRIQELKKIKAALEDLAASCRGGGPVSQCPIIEALDRQEE